MAESQREEVLGRFATFTPNVTDRDEMLYIREQMRDVAGYILDSTVPSREQSLALTALEEAKYWTNQAIARYGIPKPPTPTTEEEEADTP